MPRIKSAIKRVQVAERNRQRNISIKSAIRSSIKKVLVSVSSNTEAQAIQENLNKAYSQIDRAVVKGIIHKNTAARYKSRIAKAAGKVA